MPLRILLLAKTPNVSMTSILMNEKICPQLKPGKKAEQQAFAGKGLDCVTDVYLPVSLGEMG
jgi:DNA topoisomerase VI subunit A